MITSSKFFDKTLFTPDQFSQKNRMDEVSPWGLISSKISDGEYQVGIKKRINQTSLKGYQISRNSSQKYIQKKLKAKSFLHKSKDVSPVNKEKKFDTIQQKSNKLEPKAQTVQIKKQSKYAGSLQFIKKVINKKKNQLFPQITINQYNDLKAKGSSLLNGSGIDQVLERKKNRKKILQQFGRNDLSKTKVSKMLQRKNSRSIEQNEVVSGRYVCIAKNPQFSVNGLPTTKLSPQF